MERPSFSAVLKHAHHFTIRNFDDFIPLTIKTFVFAIIWVLGLCASLTSLIKISDFGNLQNFILSAVSLLSEPKLLYIALGILVIVVLILGASLTFCPLGVSLYRRALLDEEIDRRYLKRLFSKREINFFIAGLKISCVFIAILIIGLGCGVAVFSLASYMQSTEFNTIAFIIGIIGFIGLLLFLSARLVFVLSNVVLDRGSNLKTSIVQSRGYTFFLIGLIVLVTLMSYVIKIALQLMAEFLMRGSLGLIFVNMIIIIIGLIISYYLMIFFPAAVSHIYKFAVLKEDTAQKLKG